MEILYELLRTSNDVRTFLHRLGKVYPTKLKGDAFEYFCFYLFNLFPEQINGRYVMYQDVPDDVRLELGLPRQDIGIDALVIHDDSVDYKYTAVQCKYRQHGETVSYRELCTFLSTAFVLAKADRGIIISTSHRVHKNTKGVDNLMYGTLGDLYELCDKETFDRVRRAVSDAYEEQFEEADKKEEIRLGWRERLKMFQYVPTPERDGDWEVKKFIEGQIRESNERNMRKFRRELMSLGLE